MDKGSNLLLTLSKQITGYSPEIDRFSITTSNSNLLSALFSVMIIESDFAPGRIERPFFATL